MALFTGAAAAGTVRTAAGLEVYVIDESDFERFTTRFPRLYHNLGAILSDRLARTNRLTLREEPGRLTFLEDRGAPPLLGYALACSVAWHTREPTLLLVVSDEPSEKLRAIADPAKSLLEGRPSHAARNGKGESRARLAIVDHGGRYSAGSLPGTSKELCAHFDHVLVQVTGRPAPELDDAKTIELAPPDGAGPTQAVYQVRAWGVTQERIGPDMDRVIRVPSLEPEDHEALATGSLGHSTAAGKAIGWVARDLSGLTVGVALGAGSVRGFAHFGVLSALERADVPIDIIAGASIGASVAGIYALGHEPTEAAKVFQRGAASLFRPTVSSKGFLSNRGLRKFLQSVAGDRRIEDLPVPLAMVAADLEQQCPVVFRRGLVWEAALASGAIPGIYPAQRIGPYTVVDGGVLDPVPLNVVAEMGAGTVIGVKLSGRVTAAAADVEAVPTSGRAPSAVAAILRSIDMVQSRLAPEPSDATTILITPELEDFSGKLRSFREGIRYVSDGEAAGEAALPRIAAALPWLRR
jgi:NTE family protein